MVDVYVMRHSHVDYRPGVPITDDNPLTPLGRRIAARLAERSTAWNMQHLYVSTMLRALQTADAVLVANPGLSATRLDGLRETTPADLDGYCGPLPSGNLREWSLDHFEYSDRRRYERVRDAWGNIQDAVFTNGWERIGLVAHGGSINTLLRVFQGIGSADTAPCWFELDWASVTVLRYGVTGAQRTIARVNDSAHVDPLRDEVIAFDGGV